MRRRKIPNSSSDSNRLSVIGKITVTLLIILAGRLWYLQVIRSPEYTSLSQKNSIKLIRLKAPRGEVTGRNGNILIGNRPCFNIIVFRSTRDNTNGEEFFATLGMRKNISDFPLRKSCPVKEDVNWEEVARIEEKKLDLPEVSIEIQPKRYYPHANLASHVLGYVGEITGPELKHLHKDGYIQGNIIGKLGTEKSFEKQLKGKDGGKQVIVNASGHQIDMLGCKAPTPGDSLSLTIDYKVQKTIEDAIGNRYGSIVVMDPRNGEILGLVSRPAFDPNIFTRTISVAEWREMNSGKKAVFTNRAIQGEYPPGSTFKLIVAIAALEEGIIGTNRQFVCNGAYKVGNRMFKCWKEKGHGSVNIVEAIIHSCDVFFYQLGERVGIEKIALYAQKFGLANKTGIDLPGEKSGLIPTPSWKRKRVGSKWFPGDTVNTSIGQGFVLTTPLQMANVYSTIANGGTVYKPHVLKAAIPQVVREINLKPLTRNVILEALTMVVSRGTGYKSKVKGVEVAGKTGTSENPHGADHAWFIGFAPAKSPSVVVCVMLENAGHGSSQAAPLCGKIIKDFMSRQPSSL